MLDERSFVDGLDFVRPPLIINFANLHFLPLGSGCSWISSMDYL